jgi:hypothetical protein
LEEPTREGHESVERSPLTDSPWFWAYLFGTAALVALFLAGPRYHGRQGQLEREFAARQSAGQIVVGDRGPIMPTEGPTILPLRPLYIVLGVVWTIAWVGLWYQRFGRSTTARRWSHDAAAERCR